VERKDLIRGYATALLQVADAEDALDRVSDELFRIAKAIEQNYDLRSALTDIAVPAERKEAMLGELLGDRVSPHTKNILAFVIAQGHARELPYIVEELAALAAQTRNRVLAEVRSAVPLDEDQRRRLCDALAKATGKSVDVKVLIDPSVIGGLDAKVGDQVIDGTVRTRLAQLKEGVEA
jgi:F-type H+-transporting ATPase subunit delta